ncbi:MAG: hypothetical protein JWQ28_3057 [Pedobacter sp.]|jgi:hypothetical protein|nr:hypothetical protein [Pedobacter sp.]
MFTILFLCDDDQYTKLDLNGKPTKTFLKKCSNIGLEPLCVIEDDQLTLKSQYYELHEELIMDWYKDLLVQN